MKLHGTQTFCEIAWLQTSVLGLEEDKITWHSNYYHTKTSPLHGLEEKEIAGFSSWDGSPVLRYKYKKLQGTQTQETQSNARHRVWKKIKLHGTQTHATLWWKITEPSNSVTRSYGALEKGKIAWYSNISCMANQISPLWRRVKSYGSQINRAQYFCVHFCLKGTKKS